MIKHCILSLAMEVVVCHITHSCDQYTIYPFIDGKNQKLLIIKCIALLKCSVQLFSVIQP